jgi:hypothetical protein
MPPNSLGLDAYKYTARVTSAKLLLVPIAFYAAIIINQIAFQVFDFKLDLGGKIGSTMICSIVTVSLVGLTNLAELLQNFMSEQGKVYEKKVFGPQLINAPLTLILVPQQYLKDLELVGAQFLPERTKSRLFEKLAPDLGIDVEKLDAGDRKYAHTVGQDIYRQVDKQLPAVLDANTQYGFTRNIIGSFNHYWAVYITLSVIIICLRFYAGFQDHDWVLVGLLAALILLSYMWVHGLFGISGMETKLRRKGWTFAYRVIDTYLQKPQDTHNVS